MNIPNIITVSRKTSNIMLLVAIFIMIFIVPLTSEESYYRLLIGLNFSLLLVSSLFVVDKINNAVAIIILLLIVAQWWTDYINWELIAQALKIIIILAFIYTVVNLIIQIAAVKTISSLVIMEAINGYLLLGLVFSLLVQYIVSIDSSAYHVAPEADNSVGYIFNRGDTMYYAYSTLTTVGYGDIAPLSPLARSLSIVISTSGQIYLTAILALIVGKFANQKNDEN